jgi:hypothetical protein
MMVFWKGLQTPTAHLPVTNVSDARERWVEKYGLAATHTAAWILHKALHDPPLQFVAHHMRYYIQDAMPLDGCQTRMVSFHRLAVVIGPDIDELEFVEFSQQIPIRATAHFPARPRIPLVHWGGRRFGLESRFSLPRHLSHLDDDLILYFDFAEPIAQVNGAFAHSIGVQGTTHQTRLLLCGPQPTTTVIPVYAGHAKDNEDTAFLTSCHDFIHVRDKISTLKWIARLHTHLHVRIIDKVAIAWQRRWRKWYAARETYENTKLPSDLCWIEGDYASGGIK